MSETPYSIAFWENVERERSKATFTDFVASQDPAFFGTYAEFVHACGGPHPLRADPPKHLRRRASYGKRERIEPHGTIETSIGPVALSVVVTIYDEEFDNDYRGIAFWEGGSVEIPAKLIWAADGDSWHGDQQEARDAIRAIIEQQTQPPTPD